VAPQEYPHCNLSECRIFIESNCIGGFEQDEEDEYIREMNLNEKYKRASYIITVGVRDSIKNEIKININ
jgi:nitroreductase